MSSDKSDDLVKNVDDLKEVLSIVAEQVPGLVRGLRDVIYSAEAAGNMADSVATFYKKLVEAGIPREDAMGMARDYMINMRDMFGRKGINIGNFMHRDREEDED